MMKAILGLSLAANFVLGYFLLTKKTEKEVVERVIIETHAKNESDEPVKMQQSAPAPAKSAPKEEKKKQSIEFTHLDQVEFQDAGEKMEAERTEFLTEKLGLTEEKMAQHNRIRDEFFAKSSKMWQKNPMRELTFEERREMIAMEEELHANLEKLHGKKNWERYQKFRENYNQQGYKRQMEENIPFIFMGL